MSLLEIRNLHAGLANGGRKILNGVDLTIDTGEIHAIMGKNGSGKSTLCQVLAGREVYEVLEGEVRFNGKDLLEMSPEERAREGMFLGFQYPVEIPGVSTDYFLRAAVNEIRKHHKQPELNGVEFLRMVKEKMDLLGMDKSFMNRAINEGFSGGEKKRNEVFQMAVINPLLALLDETDSGLDVDALRTVANGVNAVKKSDSKKAILLVTHYLRMLEYIVPDKVHVMVDGKIVRSGDKTLAAELDKHGYKLVEDEVGAV